MYHIRITDQSDGSVVVDSTSDCIIGVVNHPESDESQSIAAICTNGRTLKASMMALLELASNVSRIASNGR